MSIGDFKSILDLLLCEPERDKVFLYFLSSLHVSQLVLKYSLFIHIVVMGTHCHSQQSLLIEGIFSHYLLDFYCLL